MFTLQVRFTTVGAVLLHAKLFERQMHRSVVGGWILGDAYLQRSTRSDFFLHASASRTPQGNLF